MRSRSRWLTSLPALGAIVCALAGQQANAQSGAPTLRQSIDADVLRHALHGDVWVVRPQNVYYCPGEPLYGGFEGGAFMSEDAARAVRARSARDRSCRLAGPVAPRDTP